MSVSRPQVREGHLELLLDLLEHLFLPCVPRERINPIILCHVSLLMRIQLREHLLK